MTLLQKIIEAIKESDHEVVSDLQAELNSAPNHDDDHYVHAFKCWLDDLQDMHEKAERVDDLQNGMYYIDNLVDDAENSLSEIRGYTNV
jgi:hypothetical protein